MIINTTSENTVRVYNFLKENAGEYTLNQMKDALGVPTIASILGGLTSLVKKGVLAQDDVVIDEKSYKTYYIVDTNVEFVMGAAKGKGTGELSEKANETLEILKQNPQGLSAAEVAEIMDDGSKAIACVSWMTALAKRGLIEKFEDTVDGKPVKKAKAV